MMATPQRTPKMILTARAEGAATASDGSQAADQRQRRQHQSREQPELVPARAIGEGKE
jgi:hypothetical protein